MTHIKSHIRQEEKLYQRIRAEVEMCVCLFNGCVPCSVCVCACVCVRVRTRTARASYCKLRRWSSDWLPDELAQTHSRCQRSKSNRQPTGCHCPVTLHIRHICDPGCWSLYTQPEPSTEQTHCCVTVCVCVCVRVCVALLRRHEPLGLTSDSFGRPFDPERRANDACRKHRRE